MSWLSLFIFLAMCAIMFFQTIHGMFSALIMAVVCVLGATLALGTHETLAEQVLVDLIGDYAYPAAFVGIFGVTVFGLRVLLDMFVPRNTLLPSFVDRVGSAFFGVITGLLAAGVLGIGIQMLPIGPTILGFQRYDEQDQPRHNLWLNPDAFTVNLCGYLANHTFSGETSWQSTHPDFLTELHWLRNTESGGSRISANPRSVTATGSLWTTERLYRFKRGAGRGSSNSFEAVDGPPTGMLWLGVSTQVNQDGTDSDGQYRFSPSQVRLVGETQDAITRQYTTKGVGPFDGLHLLADSQPLWGNGTGKFDFVFEVPEDFKPRFVEFKRSGRALLPKMPADLGRLSSKGSVGLAAVSPRGPVPTPTPRSGGSTTPVRPLKKDTHFGNMLPLTASRYAGTSVAARGSALSSGQLALYVDQQGQGAEAGSGRGNLDPERTPLDSFEVPSGSHMLQLNVEALHARSTLAGALNLTRRVLQQYRVIDKANRNFFPAGQIAECDSDGQRVMEVQYFPEEAELKRALKPFQRFKFDDLVGDYRYVLLFNVPEGVEIVTFDSGRSEVDLTDLHLVAGG